MTELINLIEKRLEQIATWSSLTPVRHLMSARKTRPKGGSLSLLVGNSRHSDKPTIAIAEAREVRRSWTSVNHKHRDGHVRQHLSGNSAKDHTLDTIARVGAHD